MGRPEPPWPPALPDRLTLTDLPSAGTTDGASIGLVDEPDRQRQSPFCWNPSSGSLLVFGAFTGFTLYHKFVTGLAIPGWTSSIIIASFFGALNALGIAVLGEYVVRIYDQVRGRPKFIVSRNVNFSTKHFVESNVEEDLIETLADVSALRAIVAPTALANESSAQPLSS